MKNVLNIALCIGFVFAIGVESFAQTSIEKLEKTETKMDKAQEGKGNVLKQADKTKGDVQEGIKTAGDKANEMKDVKDQGKEAVEGLRQKGADKVQDNKEESIREIKSKDASAVKEKMDATAKDKGKAASMGGEKITEQAKAAMINRSEKVKELDLTIKANETKVTAAREKIKMAADALVKEKAEGTVDDAEYSARKEKISKASMAVDALEKKVMKGSALKAVAPSK